MNLDTNNIFSITEANKNFSRVAKCVEQNDETVSKEEIKKVSDMLIEQNSRVYEALAIEEIKNILKSYFSKCYFT